LDTIDIIKIATAIAALIIAIVGHEIMHGWVAYKYGDTTAKDQGRLSLNPIVHIDLFGTILVPAMMYFIPMLLGASSGLLFGWAKPVPINTRTVINNGGYGAAMQVSLAGIAYNLVMAVIASILFTGMMPQGLGLRELIANADQFIFLYFIWMLLIINVVLAVFNLLPIPQFDGAHFVTYLSLKLGLNKIAEFFIKMEPYGMIIVIIILVVDPIRNIVLAMPVQFLLRLLLS
jgi:Zn-dependent protease